MRLALIGDPVEHSRSPGIQERLLRQAGIAGSYDVVRVRAGDAAPAIVRLREQGYTGCNVTSPLKEEVLESCERVTVASERARAVNTIYFGSTTLGTTTDGIAGVVALRDTLGTLAGRSVLVLGTGPTARAVLEQLTEEAANVWLWGRDAAKAQALCARTGAAQFTATCAPDAVFSAILPRAQLPPELARKCRRAGVVMDANYGARSTLAVQLARPVIDGSLMLEAQAQASFDFWRAQARLLPG